MIAQLVVQDAVDIGASSVVVIVAVDSLMSKTLKTIEASLAFAVDNLVLLL